MNAHELLTLAQISISEPHNPKSLSIKSKNSRVTISFDGIEYDDFIISSLESTPAQLVRYLFRIYAEEKRQHKITDKRLTIERDDNERYRMFARSILNIE